jgi:hypothetical protein
MSKDPRFTPPAERRWFELSEEVKSRLLSNVWCVGCRESTTIMWYSGRMEEQDLILEGRCMRCKGPVARVIEGESADERET